MCVRFPYLALLVVPHVVQLQTTNRLADELQVEEVLDDASIPGKQQSIHLWLVPFSQRCTILLAFFISILF
jgi:hypothetical protein